MAYPFRRPPLPTLVIAPENPYMKEGFNLPLLIGDKDDDTCCVRLDLPGVSKETLRVWADRDSNSIYFEGEDPKNDAEFDKESPRKFKGRFSLSPTKSLDRYKIDEMKYEVKDGVLKLLIPYKKD